MFKRIAENACVASVLTRGGSLTDSSSRFTSKRIAFTMAEILLSLTIIGVVAAITLPSLMGNINERTWNTQRKALHARMSQAIGMMPQLNGYGKYSYNDEEGIIDSDTTAEAFITEGLSKVLKINNICDNEHLTDCGIADKLIAMNGTTVYDTAPKYMYEMGTVWLPWTDGEPVIGAHTAGFETQNGESVLVMYHEDCRMKLGNESFAPDKLICANFIYDLNGSKGPNTVGKDVGVITALYPTDSLIVAPMLASTQKYSADSWNEAGAACTDADPTSRMPNLEEAISLEVNMSLFCGPDCYFEASVPSKTTSYPDKDKYYSVTSLAPSMNVYSSSKANSMSSIYCIKR